MAQINAPQQKDDGMDIIFRGISAARDIYGIMQDRKLANDKALLAKANEAKQAEKEMAIAAEAQRKADGVLNAGEELALYRSGKVQPAEQPGEGVIKLGYRQADGRPILGRVKDEISKPPALGEAIAQERLSLAKRQDARAAAKFEKEQARSANGQPLSPNEIDNQAAGVAAYNQLGTLDEKMALNQDKLGPIEGRLRSWNPYDTDAQDVSGHSKATAQLIGKFMEGGKLSDADSERKYGPMLPQLYDTPEVASKKMMMIRQMLQVQQAAKVAALKKQGYDTGGIEIFGQPTQMAVETPKPAGILSITTPATAAPEKAFNPAGYINKGR